ncbi:MAG: hypothetical protein IPP88_12825 [Betaproteobacteria bacterium]|nr:hypothetical protein [Betaproteobacteria bacterium]
MKISQFVLAFGIATIGTSALAKIPPAPPPDPAVAAAKAEKDKAAADKAKALQAASEDKAVQNFQANMKKAGKPIPKPTAIIVAAAPAPAVPPAKGAAPAKDAKPAKK